MGQTTNVKNPKTNNKKSCMRTVVSQIRHGHNARLIKVENKISALSEQVTTNNAAISQTSSLSSL